MAFIFLDESGDLGFKKDKKFSQFFLITALAVQDKKPIEKIVKKVYSELRKKVKRLSGGILHAYKEKPTTRKKLLQLLARQNCKILIIILNKSKVYTHLQNEKHVLYNYITNILLDRIMTKQLLPFKDGITLIAAKRETNKFLNLNFKEYLKNQIQNKHKIQIQVEIKSPSEEKALQIADFISWSCFRKYEYNDESYWAIIKNLIKEENWLYK